MRKIVDRNYLQSPKLREYLAASRKHKVVMTDYVAMEAFKGDALANIASATEILRDFPKHVVVLKNTSVIHTLKARRCGLTRRMIDRELTKVFPEWCVHLKSALAGNQDLQRQIFENGADADAHLKRMRDDQRLVNCLLKNHITSSSNRHAGKNVWKNNVAVGNANHRKTSSWAPTPPQSRVSEPRTSHRVRGRKTHRGCEGQSPRPSECDHDTSRLPAWPQGFGDCRSPVGPDRLEFRHASCPPRQERQAKHSPHSRRRAASAEEAPPRGAKITVRVRERAWRAFHDG